MDIWGQLEKFSRYLGIFLGYLEISSRNSGNIFRPFFEIFVSRPTHDATLRAMVADVELDPTSATVACNVSRKVASCFEASMISLLTFFSLLLYLLWTEDGHHLVLDMVLHCGTTSCLTSLSHSLDTCIYYTHQTKSCQ